MATSRENLVELIGPGGKTRLVGRKLWQQRVTRQSILDAGWRLKAEEDVAPVALPSLSKASPSPTAHISGMERPQLKPINSKPAAIKPKVQEAAETKTTPRPSFNGGNKKK